MRFEVEKYNIDLGTTSIENIFIEDYMPIANGTYVKVYLLTLKYIQSDDFKADLDNSIIAKNLQITPSEVEEAWDYWEEKGIIKKSVTEDNKQIIKFKNLRKIYIKNTEDRPKISEQVEKFIESMKNDEIRKMFFVIDKAMARQTYPNEKQEIISWIDSLNMSPEMIAQAFLYASDKKNIRSIRYVRGILTSWYDKGIITYEDMLKDMKLSDARFHRYLSIKKKLGQAVREVDQAELEMINSWYEIDKFSEEIIFEAIDTAFKSGKSSVNYINGILKAWKAKGIKNISEIEKLDKKPRIKSKTNNKFHNLGDNENKNFDLEQRLLDLSKKRKSGR
ncbi:MAG: DnaD domain protein [Tissierellia bacterium]|nr:DnaD domain protein [Tissierellia bacterium]